MAIDVERARRETPGCVEVLFTVEGCEAVAVRDALPARGINVSVSLVEFARLDMEARGLTQMVRASVHYYNTDDEVERFCEELEALG